MLWYELTQLQWFLGRGGPVLWVLFLVAFFLWFLIVERYWYLFWVYPRQRLIRQARYNAPAIANAWVVEQRRRATLSELHLSLSSRMSMLRCLISLCPLLGLSGTVLGMLEAFEVMSLLQGYAVEGLSRSLSRATLPTMVGMVIALSAMFFFHDLNRRIRREEERLRGSFSRGALSQDALPVSQS